MATVTSRNQPDSSATTATNLYTVSRPHLELRLTCARLDEHMSSSSTTTSSDSLRYIRATSTTAATAHKQHIDIYVIKWLIRSDGIVAFKNAEIPS